MEKTITSIGKDTVFDLKPISREDIAPDILALLIDGESIVSAFQTVRDQVIFTNLRVIVFDVHGFTGTKKLFLILPYKNILYFSVQTPSIAEVVSDAELKISFADAHNASFEFKGRADILGICNAISKFILQ